MTLQRLSSPDVNAVDQAALEASLAGERPRLVALCARITGDLQAAEDLAQETLTEAWRHQGSLRQPDKLAAWLSGVARNVCLRWGRAQGRRLRSIEPPASPSASADMMTEATRFADPFDLEADLERKELIAALDDALALLPAETRAALVARYVHEASLGEIAARLGVNEAAAAMRVQRGKYALRKILTTTLRHRVAPYLMDDRQSAWQETALWCFVCGQRHLRALLSDDATLNLTCPACLPDSRQALFATCPEIYGPVKGYGRALSRTLGWMHNYYQAAAPERSAACYVCGERLALEGPGVLRMATWASQRVSGFFQRCPACGAESSQPLAGLALATPEGRRFRQDHPRMRLLPEQEFEVDGRAAALTRLTSLTDHATLDIVSSLDTGQILRIAGDI